MIKLTGIGRRGQGRHPVEKHGSGVEQLDVPETPNVNGTSQKSIRRDDEKDSEQKDEEPFSGFLERNQGKDRGWVGVRGHKHAVVQKATAATYRTEAW